MKRAIVFAALSLALLTMQLGGCAALLPAKPFG